MAHGSVPGRSHEQRDLLVGLVLGLLCAGVIVLLALFAFSYFSLPASPLPTYPPAVVEPRPTPLWPFRKEWLTPQPRA